MDLGAWLALLPDVELFDAHTHIGFNDPDGFKQTREELLGVLSGAGAAGAFVFPMHEPDGYPPANDRVIDQALETAGQRPELIPFCRVDPKADAVAEAERSLARGARGIKLHPRAENFTLDHRVVRDLYALAHERSLPILVHAGRGIPALGVHLVPLTREFPGARTILAHAGITDLSWIWRAAAELPNLLFDSSWFMPADLLALYALIPPAQILFASDAPYGNPVIARVVQLRMALQAGFSAEQLRLSFAGQSLNIAAGRPLESAGPALGEREQAPHLLLNRLSAFLLTGIVTTMRGNPETGAEQLSLARQACEVPDGTDDGPVFTSIAALLDEYFENPASPENRLPFALVLLAMCTANTPDIPVPGVPTSSGRA
jgi:hypothetical protein